MILSMGETRPSAILARKARKLRKKTGDSRYIAKCELEKPKLGELFKRSSTKAIYLMVTEPIIISFCLWMGFAWMVFYCLISSISHLMSNLRGWSPYQVGLCYITFIIGLGFGWLWNFFIQEKWYQRRPGIPESRLYTAMIAGVTLAVGCFIYGWTSYSHVHWMGQMVGLVITLFSIFAVYNASFNYMSDAYGSHASSAIAAQNTFRNVLGGITPLFIIQWYDGLGFRWTSFMIGMIALALSSIPFILFKFGPKIRNKSKFASEVAYKESLGVADEKDSTDAIKEYS